MYLVVGSGPAGVFAARALLDHGCEVTLLDAGFELEADRKQSVDRIAKHVPNAWTEEMLGEVRNREGVSDKGVALKRVHGSDYPYRVPQGHVMASARCTVFPSYSRGGHSNVWGGAVLPYRQEDIEDWPITAGDLDPGYQRVLSSLPLCAESDDLEQLFPLHRAPDGGTPSSRQGQQLLRDAQLARKELARSGIHVGSARLAMRAPTPEGGCQLCGLCLHGCPYDHVYSSRWTLAELLLDDRFKYVKSVVVQEFRELETGIEVTARHTGTNETLYFHGDALFVGAGVLGTARLLTRSLGITTPLELLSSEHFLLPFVRYRGLPGVDHERLQTLSQLFMEIMDGTQVTAHLQFYGFNDFYPQALKARLGGLAKFMRSPLSALLGRLFAIQGYLHSDVSSRVRMTWNPSHPDAMSFEGVENPMAQELSAQIHRRLFQNRKYLRGIPLAIGLNHGRPGSGAHLGGSFPMRAKPTQEWETDPLGRPTGLDRVHVVDASVFPTIPPTTITLSIMANAYRIASQVALSLESGSQLKHPVAL